MSRSFSCEYSSQIQAYMSSISGVRQSGFRAGKATRVCCSSGRSTWYSGQSRDQDRIPASSSWLTQDCQKGSTWKASLVECSYSSWRTLTIGQRYHLESRPSPW